VSPSEGGYISGASSSIWVPPGAVQSSGTIALQETHSSINLDPPMQYVQAVTLIVPGWWPSVRRTDVAAPFTIPTTVSPAGRVGLLWGHSKFEPGDRASQCDSRDDCFLTQLTGSGLAQCYSDLTSEFSARLYESHLTHGSAGEHDEEGITFALCRYPAELHRSIVVSPSGIGTYHVEIPPHFPILESHVYLPSEQSLNSLEFCTGQEASSLFRANLDHEMGHVAINRSASGTRWIPNPTTITNVPPGTPSEHIKVSAYMRACGRDFLPIIHDRHEAYHKSHPSAIRDVSQRCAFCEDVECRPLRIDFCTSLLTDDGMRYAWAPPAKYTTSCHAVMPLDCETWTYISTEEFCAAPHTDVIGVTLTNPQEALCDRP
jgi:hypothetical protein